MLAGLLFEGWRRNHRRLKYEQQLLRARARARAQAKKEDQGIVNFRRRRMIRSMIPLRSTGFCYRLRLGDLYP